MTDLQTALRATRHRHLIEAHTIAAHDADHTLHRSDPFQYGRTHCHMMNGIHPDSTVPVSYVSVGD